MSNYTSCILILTQLIGFEKSDNEEKIILPDQVEIDTLVQFKNFLQDSNIQSIFSDELSSSSKMKMVENESFWACNHCTFHNPINLNMCEMCDFPRNVCGKSMYVVNQCEYFFYLSVFLCFVVQYL